MTSEHPITDPVETAVTRPPTRASIGRGKRVLAVVAGVAMVPALYAAASAMTGGGARPSVSAAAGADTTTTSAPGTEVETEHGVTTVTPDDSTTPSPSTTTTPETEVEHGVPVTTPATESEPGDDGATPAPTPSPAVTQTFSSTGGSIDVTLEHGALTLDRVSPAAGFTPEVHDGGGERVEVRFFDAQGKEWRIRIETAGGTFTQEITFHG
jgi:hypothetical protein